MSLQIPIVDLANLADVDNVKVDPEWLAAASKVREGLGTVGFLYLVNHGVPQDVISNVLSQSRKFFALDEQVKLKYSKDTNLDNGTFALDKYFGYTPPGGERLHPDAKLELKETYDWLHDRGTYPDAELPQFESSIAQLDSECKKFLKRFLRVLAISLDLEDADFFLKFCRHFDDHKSCTGVYNVRILHYPPLEPGVEKDNVGAVRLGEHSDYGFVTLLFQDDTGGLEVKNVNGQWTEATPIPGSILVNTGDLTEFWTAGIFPATPHRVVIPNVQDDKRSKSRYSIAFFCGPDTDCIVAPMDISKRPKEVERLAKTEKTYTMEPINAFDYMMARVANQYS